MAASAEDLAHLLRRTEFVAKPGRIGHVAGMTRVEAAEDVLSFSMNGSASLPADVVTHDPSRGWDQFVNSYNWWLNLMLTQARPLQEKMALFWHGHFTSAWWEGIGRSDYMLQQNQLFRAEAVGNFRDLTQSMAKQPAMLVYLSNAENHKNSPNQNFARELMELFTLGVGNYSESDVEAAARAWTGHNADWPHYVSTFYSHRHDYGNKMFFGTNRPWDGPDIINEILRDNGPKKAVAARFITKKLWDFFAYPNGPADVITELTNEFLATDLSIRALMKKLLSHDAFYSTAAKQGMVRTPSEWLVALSYHSQVPVAQLGGSWMGERMGQSLFNPPNVSGWKHNSYWLNTSALSGRADVARSVTWRLRNPDRFAGVYAMAVPQAVDHVANFFGIALSDTTRNALIAAHQAERATTQWENWWAVTNLLTMTMLAPEFHMA